jgi:hypothetical protein
VRSGIGGSYGIVLRCSTGGTAARRVSNTPGCPGTHCPLVPRAPVTGTFESANGGGRGAGWRRRLAQHPLDDESLGVL